MSSLQETKRPTTPAVYLGDRALPPGLWTGRPPNSQVKSKVRFLWFSTNTLSSEPGTGCSGLGAKQTTIETRSLSKTCTRATGEVGKRWPSHLMGTCGKHYGRKAWDAWSVYAEDSGSVRRSVPTK